jgi:hypothetical protein
VTLVKVKVKRHVGFKADKGELEQFFPSISVSTANSHFSECSIIRAGAKGQVLPTCQVDSGSMHPKKLKKESMRPSCLCQYNSSKSER